MPKREEFFLPSKPPYINPLFFLVLGMCVCVFFLYFRDKLQFSDQLIAPSWISWQQTWKKSNNLPGQHFHGTKFPPSNVVRNCNQSLFFVRKKKLNFPHLKLTLNLYGETNIMINFPFLWTS